MTDLPETPKHNLSTAEPVVVPSENQEEESKEEPNIATPEKPQSTWSRKYFRSASHRTVGSLQGIDKLQDEEYLFIRRAKHEFESDFIDSSHIYEILNSSEEPVFNAVKTFQYENCDRLLELDVSILECEGGGVLSIKGDSVKISVCSLTFGGDLQDELGKILNHRKDGYRSKQELDIVFDNKKQYKLIKSPKERGEFEIVWNKEDVACVGKVSFHWANWLRHPLSQQYYGVGFSKGMDVKSKAFLMAAMIFLYFENFDSHEELRRGFFTFDRICCLIFGILFVIIITSLIVVAVLRFAYSEFRA